MSSVRAVAWGVLIWLALPSVTRADSLTSNSWTFFFDPGSSDQSFFNSGSSGPAPVADAYLNFGSGNFSEASILTTGTAAPWYTSPAVSQAYGHTPTPAEQAAFTSKVLADVNATYALAGLKPQITTDPTVPANHMLSVVSGLSFGPNPNAIGITDVGHDGFGFIDKLNYATNPDQLAWAVAHNVSHELMHAFGVAIHSDTTGKFIDAASATWNLLTDPNASFSPSSVSLISATNFGPSMTSAVLSRQGELLRIDGDQEVMAVPEPTTLVAWTAVLAGLLFRRRRMAWNLAG